MSILSERRAFQPFGIAGGGPGGRGLNLLQFGEDKRVISLGGKNTVPVSAGDRIVIHTPGGGGYGEPSQAAAAATAEKLTASQLRMTSGSLNQYTLNQESV